MSKALDLVKNSSMAFTEDRHKMEEEMATSRSNHHDDSVSAIKKYMNNNPVGGWFDGLAGNIDDHELQRNRAEWERHNHAKGENSWNPFRGLTDKSYHENKKSRGQSKEKLPEK